MRMPLTLWSMFLVAILGLLAFPALTAASPDAPLRPPLRHELLPPHRPRALRRALVRADGRPLHQGGSPLLWQHLFWFLGHPEVYILMLPALGFTSDIIAVFARKAIFGYKAMVGAMIAIAGLSFVVWGHHMFVSGMNPYLGHGLRGGHDAHRRALGGEGVQLARHPVAGRGSSYKTPMLWAMGVVSLFISGGLSGIWLGQSAVDIHAPRHLLRGRPLPPDHGRRRPLRRLRGHRLLVPEDVRPPDERRPSASSHFWFTFVAYYCTFFPMHYIGIAGHMRRIYDPYQYEFLKNLQPHQPVHHDQRASSSAPPRSSSS